MTERSISEQFAADGYSVVSDMLSSEGIRGVVSNFKELATDRASTRKLLDMRWCKELARRLAREPSLRAVLPADAHAVQCTLFEKALDKNWLVALHQDLSIPVAERIDSALCTGWSAKEGDLFVQPPISVLEDLVAVRVHLDACDERNGALRVVPGSHRLGRLSSAQALNARAVRGERVVPVPRGSVMVMRPLLLHASSKATADLPRRVLHFVFGPSSLPEGLSWRQSPKPTVAS
jgi:ectoine hydroxylase-related dioxygenase (phytanoyl-CoA dioxygenase family)